jgi:two-component system, cell cycle sensor histidine kinase and response regulator CckA
VAADDKSVNVRGKSDIELMRVFVPMFENSMNGMLLTAPDGRIFAANSAACEMLGRSEEEICAIGREAVVDPTDPDLWVALEERRKTGRSRKQFRLKRADGSTFVADVTSSIFVDENGEQRASLAFRDISEQRALEDELRESEQRFRLLSDAAFEGIAIHEEGRVVEANEAYAKLFGYEVAETIGMNIGDFAAPESRLHVLSLIARGVSEPYEYTGIRKDGSRFACEANGRTTIKHGRPARVVAARDISERKRREDERERNRRRLMETEKLESLAVLAGGVAHDFNNLLMVMLGNASLAKEKVEPGSEPAELLESVIEAIERAAALAGKMQAYSGGGRAIVGPIALNDAVSAEIDELRFDISTDVEITCELAGDPPAVCADRGQIRQLLRNLIENAVEAIGAKAGTVTVSTGVVDADTSYLAKTYLGDELEPMRYAYIEVDDDGEGIDKEIMARIFEPFFSTRFQGRGLGLAAALGIIRAHKGAFVIDSKIHRGTTVRALRPAPESTPGQSPCAKS